MSVGLKTTDLGRRYPPYVISVVVPLLNEEHSLDELYREIVAALEPRGEPFEVVFVDDGSSDGSPTVLGQLHDQHANVVVVRLRRNFGKAAALQAGFLEARGDTVVTIDADLQDDPSEIPPCSPSWTRASTSSPAGRRGATTRSSGGSSPACSTGRRG